MRVVAQSFWRGKFFSLEIRPLKTIAPWLGPVTKYFFLQMLSIFFCLSQELVVRFLAMLIPAMQVNAPGEGG